MTEKEEFMSLMERHPELRAPVLQILLGSPTSDDAGRDADADDLTEQEKEFLHMANDPELREDLLARLEKLGLLSDFLQVERGSI